MIRGLKCLFTKINRKTFSKVCDPYRKLQRIVDFETNIKINPLLQHEKFTKRHIGPNQKETNEMLKYLKVNSIEDLISETVPKSILLNEKQRKSQDDILGEPIPENIALHYLKRVASLNKIYKSYLGQGYHPVITPNVILRNVLENPAWYTSYTPYQAEISQGRLESLLNYQTLVGELTGLKFSNASLLDEATAAGESMFMAYNISGGKLKDFFVSNNLFPHIIDTIKTRAHFLNINVVVGCPLSMDFSGKKFFGGIVQNPGNKGEVSDWSIFAKKLHDNGGIAIVNCDIMSLLISKTPSAMGFDIAVGSAQRFGVPMMNGGPHAGFMTTKDEFKRKMPGRIIGMSIDCHEKPALRLAMQTREQHIRRDKATSNICTAQALLANISAFYSIFHGKQGLINISLRLNQFAYIIQNELSELGFKFINSAEKIYDTVSIDCERSQIELATVMDQFEKNKINLREINDNELSITVNEQMTIYDVEEILTLFAMLRDKKDYKLDILKYKNNGSYLSSDLHRTGEFLQQDIFNKFTSETQLLRYIYSLQLKDISLCNSMISLGSCTMKMNATCELIPVTWPEFSEIHPLAPADQTSGYSMMIAELEGMLKTITQFDGVSLQPNSGANGEFAGLIAIRRFFDSIHQGHRNICLIPNSAHGTNPASAAISGMKVIVVNCDKSGNIDINDLKTKAEKYSKDLCALMVTYPSTHGVYEEGIDEICEIVHKNGGQVYMDGANMNAQVLITSPASIGADVCHLNLHKTFCIPHGGGGPGVGPICVKKHLIPFLPGHEFFDKGGEELKFSTTSAPFGSAGILPISYMYIKMMGKELLKSTQIAILNANYIMERLCGSYKILYKGSHGRIAHEFIFDVREFKEKTGVTETDVAKRLIDYGFHAPTMSFPVPGTLMIEPTESEDKAELDRFCDALIQIREEIREIENGICDKVDNVLKNAPHTEEHVVSDNWNHKYSREKAAFPLPYIKKRGKFWPSVGRVDNVYGDLNLVCSCPSINDYNN